MASTQRVVVVDDSDGSTESVEAVWIGLDADLYVVDLSAQHRQQRMAVLGPFIAHARLLPQDKEPPHPRRPYVPSPYGHMAKVVLQARTALTSVGYEYPDYPWFPFKNAGKRQVEQVWAWAAQQGIPMPHRGIPRSVLLAFGSAQQPIEQPTENEGSSPRT